MLQLVLQNSTIAVVPKTLHSKTMVPWYVLRKVVAVNSIGWFSLDHKDDWTDLMQLLVLFSVRYFSGLLPRWRKSIYPTAQWPTHWRYHWSCLTRTSCSLHKFYRGMRIATIGKMLATDQPSHRLQFFRQNPALTGRTADRAFLMDPSLYEISKLVE